MTLRSILFFLTFLAMAFGACAAPRKPLHSGPAADLGKSPASMHIPARRLHAAIRDYDSWLDELARHRWVSGMATAVIVDGHVRYERTLGYADTETGERVRPATVFRIASLSKAFASALVGQMVHDGRLHWDTHLINVLPFFDLSSSGATQKATVADILGQRLGLPRHTYDSLLEADVPYPKLARELDQVNLRCQVGRCYSYQNVAFSLVGDVVHALTGSFYAYEVEKRLFLPLGMTTATYGLDALEHSASWARPHWHARSGWKPFMPREAYYRVAPAAGVNASLRDMEQWLLAQMGGRPDVLSRHLLDTLHAPGVATPSETYATPWRRARVDDAHYALGWRVYDYAGHTMIFHAGAVRGYRAIIGFLPDQRVGVIMMWNCAASRPAGLFPMFMDRVLGLAPHDWAHLEHD